MQCFLLGMAVDESYELNAVYIWLEKKNSQVSPTLSRGPTTRNALSRGHGQWS